MSDIEDVLGAELAKLTPKQRSRAVATLAGKTPSEIARGEGVSKQAVAETLAAPIVVKTLRNLLTGMQVSNGGPFMPVVERALEVVVEMLAAKKAVIYGGSYVMVVDHDARFRAATHLLGLYEPRNLPPASVKAPVVEDVAIVEETSTRRIAGRRSTR